MFRSTYLDYVRKQWQWFIAYRTQSGINLCDFFEQTKQNKRATKKSVHSAVPLNPFTESDTLSMAPTRGIVIHHAEINQLLSFATARIPLIKLATWCFLYLDTLLSGHHLMGFGTFRLATHPLIEEIFCMKKNRPANWIQGFLFKRVKPKMIVRNWSRHQLHWNTYLKIEIERG